MGRLNHVDLPGLIGREPLGFLATMGLEAQLLHQVYLSWDPADGHAILHSERYATIADVVAELKDALATVKSGQAIPGIKGFPIPRNRGMADPLRIRSDEYRKVRARQERSGSYYWFDSVVTDRAVDANGFCVLNPLVGIRGRQTAGSFWYYPMMEVKRDPERLLTEALTGWRRVAGAEGWLLDHRATYSFEPALRGPGGSMAVPGATWLATLALQRFRYRRRNGVETGRPVLPNGWFRVADRDVFAWPIWTTPISGTCLDAVWNVGWGYDAWKFTANPDGSIRAEMTRTHGISAPNNIDHVVDLNILDLYGAARSTQGVLTPVAMRTRRVPGKFREYDAWKGWDWKYPPVPDYPGKYGHG
ncbi:hypothetical protein C8D88_104420 [Lentzea atacamensis]|uniref:Uncharacterized protein n=1 Tax=Lentzea atacamensis TaxID=531938 RepID=A0A316IJ91_9PSEU|nr:hypothetical protein [Lentzea atacamensis]PWK87259.1 hypothetical protein C8D88_104420 [Lentzea atacamensis]